MGSNREVIEDPPEADAASEVDRQSDEQADDSGVAEVRLGDDEPAEAAPARSRGCGSPPCGFACA